MANIHIIKDGEVKIFRLPQEGFPDSIMFSVMVNPVPFVSGLTEFSFKITLYNEQGDSEICTVVANAANNFTAGHSITGMAKKYSSVKLQSLSPVELFVHVNNAVWAHV